MFKNSPIIGQGVNSYRIKCHDYKFKIHDKSCSNHPHNLVLQILSELGLVGFSFYFFFMIFILKKIFLNIYYNKSNNYNLFLAYFYLINFFPLISYGNVFNNWLSILIFLPLGFLINSHYKVN